MSNDELLAMARSYREAFAGMRSGAKIATNLLDMGQVVAASLLTVKMQDVCDDVIDQLDRTIQTLEDL